MSKRSNARQKRRTKKRAQKEKTKRAKEERKARVAEATGKRGFSYSKDVKVDRKQGHPKKTKKKKKKKKGGMGGAMPARSGLAGLPSWALPVGLVGGYLILTKKKGR